MRSGPGRPWQLPTRQPASQGRDQLVLALEAKAGLTSRKAKAVVNAFWKRDPGCRAPRRNRGNSVGRLSDCSRSEAASAAAVG